MIILWPLTLVLRFLVSLILQAVTLPLLLPLNQGWMSYLRAMSQNPGSGSLPPPPVLSSGYLVLGALVTGVVTLLVSSFVQTFGLTMYAEVYRRLTGSQNVPVGPEASPPSGYGQPATTLSPAAPSVVETAVPVARPTTPVAATDAPALLVPDEEPGPETGYPPRI
jgi:hypothetical protein